MNQDAKNEQARRWAEEVELPELTKPTGYYCAKCGNFPDAAKHIGCSYLATGMPRGFTVEEVEVLRREAIAAALVKLTQWQEPVAWMIWLYGTAGLFEHRQFAELEFERRNKEYPHENRKLVSLYAHPAPSQQEARKPLTDGQIHRAYQELWPFHPQEEPMLAKDMIKFTRAIEAAHGIKEQQ